MGTRQQALQPDPAQLSIPALTQLSSATTLSQMSVVEEPVEPPPLELSPEQQLVLTKVMQGDNVFFTGPAGESEYGVFFYLDLAQGRREEPESRC